MPKYGLPYYGSVLYGPDHILDYDASPFICTPTDHATLQLTWQLPKGNWTRIRLVRNAYGYPTSESDGIVLLDVNCGPSATGTVAPGVSAYLDTLVPQGQFFYYSLFVYGIAAYNGRDDWRRCGDVQGLSVQDFAYTDKMLSLLPTAFTTDLDAVGSAGYDGDTPIARYLSLHGYQLDYIRTQYETLRNLYNIDKVSGAVLPALGAQFGIDYEPEIGMSQWRVVVRNALHVAKTKGTSVGVEALCTAYSGWACDTQIGVNLLLDYNDSSFEESVGRWHGNDANSSITRVVAGSPPAYVAPFNNKQAGLARVTTVTSTGTATAILANTDPVRQGIPVVAGTTYTFSAFVRAATTARTVTLAIQWYSKTGVLLSTTTGTGVADATGGWTVRPTATGAAPTNAVYAGVSVAIAAVVAGEAHYLDALQFEASPTVSVFQEARDLRISLTADRVNNVANPSFEVGVTNWGGTNATLAQTSAVAFSGTKACQVTATAAGDATASDTFLVAVTPSTSYTASAYVRSAATSVNAVVTLLFYDSAGTTLLSAVSGTPVATSTSAWTRGYVTAVAPSNAALVSVRVTFKSAAASSVHYFDAALFEKGNTLLPYFDASTAGTHPSDYLWEGTAHASRSHYYENRGAKVHRLGTLLLDYVSIGSTFTLLVAQQGVIVSTGGSTSSVVDNGDGTFSYTPATDNGDGTFTASANDNGDGTATYS